MKQQNEVQHVIELLSRWLTQVRLSSALTYYDINKISEDFACKLLNAIYGYELINLNAEKQNFPGIDLGDRTKSLLAFQISSRTDGEKIRETLRTFAGKGYDRVFKNGVRFLILNQEKVKFGKQNPKKIYPPFSKSKHVLTDKDIIRDISSIYNRNPEQFSMIKQLLQEEFGEKPNIEESDSKTPQPPLSPDTYLFIFGQENSFYPFAKGRKKGRMKVSITPVQASRDLPDVQIPKNLFEWKYPPGTKMFTVYCENRRDVIDSNIKIDIHFNPGTSIRTVEITNKNRLQILNGGKPTSNFISYHIPQLLPGERQELRIITKGKGIEKAKGWSEKMGSFGDIFIYDIIFGSPEELEEIPPNVKSFMFDVG